VHAVFLHDDTIRRRPAVAVCVSGVPTDAGKSARAESDAMDVRRQTVEAIRRIDRSGFATPLTHCAQRQLFVRPDFDGR
jgi:hypothetical protein